MANVCQFKYPSLRTKDLTEVSKIFFNQIQKQWLSTPAVKCRILSQDLYTLRLKAPSKAHRYIKTSSEVQYYYIFSPKVEIAFNKNLSTQMIPTVFDQKNIGCINRKTNHMYRRTNHNTLVPILYLSVENSSHKTSGSSLTLNYSWLWSRDDRNRIECKSNNLRCRKTWVLL